MEESKVAPGSGLSADHPGGIQIAGQYMIIPFQGKLQSSSIAIFDVDNDPSHSKNQWARCSSASVWVALV